MANKENDKMNVKKLIALCDEKVDECVKTVYSFCQIITGEELMTTYGIEWKSIADRYGLIIEKDDTSFANAPVFFTSAPDDINVCALSFALLILYKGLERIERKKQEETAALGLSIDAIKKMIVRLTNTVAVIACREDSSGKEVYYWPTTITKTRIVSTGTCNQTTVALSALLRIGFISKNLVNKKNEDGEITEEQLQNRYNLVVGALSWLISCQTGADGNAWSYGTSCMTEDEVPISYSILSSHFCYETLKKYRLYFDETDCNERATKADSHILDGISASCRKFENWAKSKIMLSNEKGGVGKTDTSGVNNSSVLHTCLIQIVFMFDTDFSSKGNIETLTKAVDYVLKNLNNFNLDEDRDLLETYFYKYKTSEGAQGYKGDVYEIVPEYVFLNYSTQLIKTGFYLKLSATRKNKLKEANYIAYEKLLRKIVEIDYKSNNPEDKLLYMEV